jgi:polysaccharide chain length determinant protein (PEP-CTERM system associated)
MLGGRQLTLDDYWAVLRRRRWLIIIPLILGPVIAVLVARHLPPRYTSTSLILIEEPKVPEDFVPSIFTNDLMARVAHMEEQILSRTRLEPIIQQYGLYRSDWNHVSMEALADRMRDAILVTPVAFSNEPGDGGSGGNQVPGFKVEFTGDSPQMAQNVCSQITSMLINANLELGVQRAQGTANFIQGELQDAKKKLEQQDAQLAAFQRQYFGSLPDQEQSSIQYLRALSDQLNSVSETLRGYQESKTYQESLLSQQLAAWKASQTGNSPQTLEGQLAHAQDNLAALETQYTDTYPDVVEAKQQIAALRAKIAQQKSPGKKGEAKSASGPSSPATSEPPQILQLRASLRSLNLAIQDAQMQQKRLRRQIAGNEAQLRLTPAVEQQYADITRNYQTSLNFYNSLLAKEDQSQMSTNLEQQQEGQQFDLLDPADLPGKPSFPNLERFAGGGLLVGLVLGLGLAFILELRDKALRDERDVEFFLELPILAVLPAIHKGPKSLKQAAQKKPREVTGARAV